VDGKFEIAGRRNGGALRTMGGRKGVVGKYRLTCLVRYIRIQRTYETCVQGAVGGDRGDICAMMSVVGPLGSGKISFTALDGQIAGHKSNPVCHVYNGRIWKEEENDCSFQDSVRHVSEWSRV